MGIIEAIGTGILRIKAAYQNSATKPEFTVRENSITVVLPLLKEKSDLSPDQQRVYDTLSPVRAMPISEIVPLAGFSKSKVNGILKSLIASGAVYATGTGRGTKYIRS